MPEIYSIVYKTEEASQNDADAYARVPLQTAFLRSGSGIDGDLKGGHPDRQLNIMCYETLTGLNQEGFKTEPGAMGEQIIIKGLDLIDLSPGTRVQFGDSAQIEVVKPRTGCDRFEHIQGLSRHQAQDRMGVMARVVQDGEISVGDSVTVL
ncbi:MAG: MOSC domain-containing protein [Anaerolineae bacterium]|nr:MOSC domain-containing protein [Anaerolineae bacterium]